MPTSATGTWTAEAGFTLLEVMVTLALIGIVTGFAVLSLPGDPAAERLDREARRLLQIVTLQRDEAVLLGETRGIRFTPDGYHALRRTDDGTWESPVETGITPAYRLPDGLRLQLELDGRSPPQTGEQPQVLLFATGEASAFRAMLHGPGGLRTGVSGDLLGRLERVAPP